MSQIPLAAKASTPQVIGPVRLTAAALNDAGAQGVLMGTVPPGSLVTHFWMSSPGQVWGIEDAVVVSEGSITLQPGQFGATVDNSSMLIAGQYVNLVFAPGPDPLVLTVGAPMENATPVEVVSGLYALDVSFATSVEIALTPMRLTIGGRTTSTANYGAEVVGDDGEVRAATFSADRGVRWATGEADFYVLVVPAISQSG